MDSVTQIVLGAAVGEAVLGRRVGRRASLWGAVCGTLPDLDVLIPFADAVADFTYHRSFSHSLFVLAALTPAVAWFVRQVHGKSGASLRQWMWLVWLVFVTHVLLDCMTVYGTQVFWPITDHPFGLGTVFVIDPAYTLLLLVGPAAVALRGGRGGYRWNGWMLTLSSLYLAWGVLAGMQVRAQAEQALQEQGIEYRNLLVTPTPLNSLLWRIVAKGESGYHVAYVSVLDPGEETGFASYPSNESLLASLDDSWAVRRLRGFTKGFYSVEEVDGYVVISDLRMGLEPDYAFRFRVGRREGDKIVPLVPTTRLRMVRDVGRLQNVARRIFDPAAPDP